MRLTCSYSNLFCQKRENYFVEVRRLDEHTVWVLNPKCDFKGKKKHFWAGPWEKKKRDIFNNASFDINILHAPLANIFVVLLKMHKTAICSPKGLGAAMRAPKEERGFIPISSSLRKSLWKKLIFLHYPMEPSGLCFWNAQEVFLYKSCYQKSCRPFWRKYVVFKIICYSVCLLFWHNRE